MKIEPRHDYKKPLYAVGVAALIGSAAVFGTGCFGPQLAGEATVASSEHKYGGKSKIEQTELQLAGDTQVVETEPEFAGEVDETGPMIAGGLDIVETEPVIEGDMFIDESYYDDFTEGGDDGLCEKTEYTGEEG